MTAQSAQQGHGCPPWCTEATDPTHWRRSAVGTDETVHEAAFGLVTVNVPEERLRPGRPFVGAAELNIDDDLLYFFPSQGEELLANLTAALEFARNHDERVTALARAGRVETSSRLTVDGQEVDQ